MTIVIRVTYAAVVRRTLLRKLQYWANCSHLCAWVTL